MQIYARGEQAVGTGSPVYAARLLLAHGRLLRRTGSRKDAVDGCAGPVTSTLRCAPRRSSPGPRKNSAACRLPASPAAKQSVLALTSRETEVAHLIGKGLSNQEIAAELFISRKAVEYHLGNIYAKLGLQGRRELRRFVGQEQCRRLVSYFPFRIRGEAAVEAVAARPLRPASRARSSTC